MHVLYHFVLRLKQLLKHLIGLVSVLRVLVPLRDQVCYFAFKLFEVVGGLFLLDFFNVRPRFKVIVVFLVRFRHKSFLEPIQEVHGLVEGHIGCLADSADSPRSFVPIVELIGLI